MLDVLSKFWEVCRLFQQARIARFTPASLRCLKCRAQMQFANANCFKIPHKTHAVIASSCKASEVLMCYHLPMLSCSFSKILLKHVLLHSTPIQQNLTVHTGVSTSLRFKQCPQGITTVLCNTKVPALRLLQSPQQYRMKAVSRNVSTTLTRQEATFNICQNIKYFTTFIGTIAAPGK